jgi:hypothetical protein
MSTNLVNSPVSTPTWVHLRGSHKAQSVKANTVPIQCSGVFSTKTCAWPSLAAKVSAV